LRQDKASTTAAGSAVRALAHLIKKPRASLPGLSCWSYNSLDYVRCAHRGGQQHALRLFRPKPQSSRFLSSTDHGGGKRWSQTGTSIANHHSANSPNATRQSLAISCCGCGSRDIFSNIAFGYTAPTRKTAATNSGMSCLRFIWIGAACASRLGSVF